MLLIELEVRGCDDGVNSLRQLSEICPKKFNLVFNEVILSIEMGNDETYY